MSEREKPWTPGPWETYPACNYIGYSIAPRGTLPTLAAVERPAGSDSTINVQAFNFPGKTEANARLIAAAPELVEALESLIEQCPCSLRERDSGHKIDCRVPEAKTLLAKIYGEES